MKKKLFGIIFLLFAQCAFILDSKKISFLKINFFSEKGEVVENNLSSNKNPQKINYEDLDEETKQKFNFESLDKIDEIIEKSVLIGRTPMMDEYAHFSMILLKASCLEEKFNMSDVVVNNFIEDEINKKDLDKNEALRFYSKKNLSNYLVLFDDYFDESKCKFVKDDIKWISYSNQIKFRFSVIKNDPNYKKFIDKKVDDVFETVWFKENSLKRNDEFVEAKVVFFGFDERGNLSSFGDYFMEYNCKEKTSVNKDFEDQFGHRPFLNPDVGNYFCKPFIDENAYKHNWVSFNQQERTQIDMKSLSETDDGFIRGNLRWLSKDGYGSSGRSFEIKCKEGTQFVDSITPTLRYFKINDEWWLGYQINQDTRYESYLSNASIERQKKYNEENDLKLNRIYKFLCSQ